MKKFLITEDERVRILKLYNLIKENIDPKVGGTITVKNYYPAGYYTITKEMGQQIVNQLKPVTDFIRTNPDSIVDILLVSQESAIPNYDNEGLKGKSWLDEGKLSEFRQEYLNTFFQNYFNQLKKSKFISDSVQTPPVRLNFKKPTTPFEGSFCPKGATIEQKRGECYKKWKAMKASDTAEYKDLKSKYDKEQNSEILITVKKGVGETPPECATGLKITVSVETHECQNAEFFIYANNTLLKNVAGGNTANLNNSKDARPLPNFDSPSRVPAQLLNPGYGKLKNGDENVSYGFGKGNITGDIGKKRSDTFIIDKTQSPEIVKAGKGSITIWMIATTGDAHDDIPSVLIEKDGEIVFNGKPKINKGKLITLDGCGTKVLENAPEDVPVPDWVTQRQTHAAERLEGSKGYEEELKKQQLDFKSQVLGKTENLNSIMSELVNKIKTEWKNDKPSEHAQELKKYYDNFIKLINDKDFSFQITMTKNGYHFRNPQLRSDPLFGDLRQRMEKFYNQFLSIYYDDRWESSGTKGGFKKILNSTE